MLKIIHRTAGTIALLTIFLFWTSTIVSEVSGDPASVTAVKTAIPWGLLLLVPALAATGATGARLANGRRVGLIGAKFRRMPFIAGNGLLILVPSAFFLAHKATAAEFDTTFYVVQAIELLAGATNILLLGSNMRDGLKLTGRLSRRA